MLVVDSNVTLALCQRDEGFADLGDPDLFAPPFMWAEVRSGLHEAVMRGAASRVLASGIIERLDLGTVTPRSHPELGARAWRIADDFGWYTTYDAEYVALADLLGCRLVTLDMRLRRGAQRLGFVVTPTELLS